jgi:hypothetical protein
MTHKPDPTFAATEAWLSARRISSRRTSRYQLKIGPTISYYPNKGTVFVDGEDEARPHTGLPALEVVLREQGYLGGPTAPTTPPRHAGPTQPTLSVTINPPAPDPTLNC